MSVYLTYAKSPIPEFGVDAPWRKGPLNLGDIAYEVLNLPDGSEWIAPCGTPDPCPPELPHRYYRHVPLAAST